MKYKYLISITVFISFGLLTFSNSFDVPFHFDDAQIIQNNYQVNNLNKFTELPTWFNVQNRTFSLFTFAINRSFSGDNVFSYHATNLVIHLLFVITCFILSLVLLKQLNYSQDLSFWFSFLSSLILLTHPINTQAVVYIVQRMTLLSSLFYVGSLLFYLLARTQWTREGLKANIFLYFICSGLCAYLAIMSKQIAASIPLMFILFEFTVIRKNGKVDTKFIFIIALTLFATITLAINLLNIPTIETSSYSRLEYIMTQSRVILKYIGLLLFPINLNLDYDFKISYDFLELKTFLSTIVISTILILSVSYWKRFKLASIGVLWFFIALSIESSVIPIRDVIMEHRTYLPSLGFVWFLLGIVNLKNINHYKEALIGSMSIIIVVLSLTAHQRNKVWKSDHSLWKDVVLKSPNKTRPNNNFGFVLFHQNKLDSAKHFYKKAVANSSLPEAHNNLASIYINENNYEEALSHVNLALSKRQKFGSAHNNRGLIYYHHSRIDSAIISFKKSIKSDPYFLQAYFNLAITYESIDSIQYAQDSYDQIINLNADHFDALFNCGNLMAKNNRIQEAYLYYEKAFELKPQSTDLLGNLAELFLIKGDTSRANYFFQKIQGLKLELY